MSTNVNVVVDNKPLIAAAKELQRQHRLAELAKLRKEFAEKREARKKREGGVDPYKKKKETGIRKTGDNSVFGGYLIKEFVRNDRYDNGDFVNPAPISLAANARVSCGSADGTQWVTVNTAGISIERPAEAYDASGGVNILYTSHYGLASDFYTLAFPVGGGVSLIAVICEVQGFVHIVKGRGGLPVFTYPTCWEEYSTINRDIVVFKVEQSSVSQIATPPGLTGILDLVCPPQTYQIGQNQLGQPASFCPTSPSPHPTQSGAFFWPQSYPGGYVRGGGGNLLDDTYNQIVSYPSVGNNLANAYTETNDVKWFGPNIYNWLYSPHIPQGFFDADILDDTLSLAPDSLVGTYSEVDPNYQFPYYGQGTDNIIATGNIYDIIGYYGHSIDMRFIWFTPGQRAQAYPNIINAGYSSYLNPAPYWSFGYLDFPDTGSNVGKAAGIDYNAIAIDGILIGDFYGYGYTSSSVMQSIYPGNVIEFPCSDIGCTTEFTLTELDDSADYWTLSENRTLPSHLNASIDFQIEVICVCDLAEDWTSELIGIGFDPEVLG